MAQLRLRHFHILRRRGRSAMQPFIEAKREEIAALCRTHHVRRLSIFGSAVRDDFDPQTSDVDVRVELDENAEKSAFDSFDFRDKLIELLGREVDLISAREIENPYLRRIVENSQVTLYAA
jgi:predicted nucleotidyltransferase